MSGKTGVFFFSYAVLMNRGHMSQVCPHARAVGKALLRGYRMVFPRVSSMWMGGIPSLQEAEGEEIWGVLWWVCKTCEPELDRYQGFLGPEGDNVYARFSVVVETGGGTQIEAFSYRAAQTSKNSFPPSPEFMETVLRAAREFELPEEYVQNLERLA